MAGGGASCSAEVERILRADLPELEKVVQAFDCIARFVVADADREIELAQALQDREQVIRLQIKKETMKHARSVLETCYRRVTGRRPWDGTGR